MEGLLLADVLSSYLLLSEAAWDLQPPYEVLMSFCLPPGATSKLSLRDRELSLIPENFQQGGCPGSHRNPDFFSSKARDHGLFTNFSSGLGM